MKYISTRDKAKKFDSAEVIKMGLSNEGGLFVPENVPKITVEELDELKDKSYQEIAKSVLKRFLTDYTDKEIEDCISLAYNNFTFSTTEIAPIKKISENMYILELWHGPTAAFKDMALQIMPHFLAKAIKKTGSTKEIVILVATSGDTGKAALEGYKDVDGIKIIVFYPEGGVSKVQELQMVTTEGSNTNVVAVHGNFDDCQTAVKDIFGDKQFNEFLNDKGYEFSSANSINWGRLVPQIVYYFSAYLNLVRNTEIVPGERINFAVPTGNFGNILAGYYAKLMGLPIDKLICASNINNILADFFKTGVYDRNREFYKTMSPSMDILISSNLERFLFELTGHDEEKIRGWYRSLKEIGRFEIDAETKEKIDKLIVYGYTDEASTADTIKNIFNESDYLLDTHTAVAVNVVKKYGSSEKTVVDSTANPYKFSDNVLKAVCGDSFEDEFKSIEELNKFSGMKVHRAIRELDKKEVKNKHVVTKDGMKDIIKEILKI